MLPFSPHVSDLGSLGSEIVVPHKHVVQGEIQQRCANCGEVGKAAYNAQHRSSSCVETAPC